MSPILKTLPPQACGFKFFSNKFKIRLYSSAQLAGSTKPWFSAGYTANSNFFPQFDQLAPSSETVSWKCTFVSAMP